MAVYQFSALANGQAISFNPGVDRLNFDQTTISAADVGLLIQGSDLSVSAAGKSIVLTNTSLPQLATSNLSFANGSLLAVGDNASGTARSQAAKTLACCACHAPIPRL